MQKYLTPFISLAALITVVWLFSMPIGPLPPAGSFFHPVRGFWANAETKPVAGLDVIPESAISAPVEVYYDERGVPHIFAENDEDLYFAQGYVTARDRLFQMEIQIRAAGGMLAEWLGPGLVEYDRNQRRLGMLYGAEQAMKEISAHPEIAGAIQAYADGVNAYIDGLNYKTFPIEYKLLNVEPAAWQPLNTALLLKYMTQMLAARNDDVATSNTRARFGQEFVDRFLSERPNLMDPIMPPDTPWNFNPEPDIPNAPDTLYRPTFTQPIELWQPDRLNGSNNWVVDGSKTAGGYPILSNDMHLNMSMPSIWYEIQLQTPDHNAYGVSLQGTPAIIVGFNEHIAWGSTNAGADVMDWYEITFRDESRSAYLYAGEWNPVETRIETIRIKGTEAVTDTILFTHHGPVYETREPLPPGRTIRRDHALRWIGHDPSNELLTFYRLNRAQNYDDFHEAFRTFKAPAQNMNFASVDGDIAMQTGGLFPLKWQYQGRTVGDGSDPQYDWQGFIPYDHNPRALNPDRGFLSAANQFPVAESYPYYLGEDFAPFERGRRINDLLAEMENITVEDFSEMLMDSYSYLAALALPVMLEAMDITETELPMPERLNQLADWDFMNDGERIEPSLFYTWWNLFYDTVWGSIYNSEFVMRRPDRDKTLDLLLEDPQSPWFDDPSTEIVETAHDLIRKTWPQALNRLRDRYGDNPGEWLWGRVNNTNLNHVAQIGGFGVRDLFTDGGRESVNAIRGSHGPSWRMIVELDPEGVRAYGVYPGGQSGNPGSKTYDEFVETWRTGELYELNFLREKPAGTEGYPLVIRFE